MRIFSLINTYVYGAAFAVFLCIAGIFFCFRLGFFPMLHPAKTLACLTGRKRSFRALTLALAGTLGVGNIVGVAAAIKWGGAGAVFWMWVSAFATMLIKYAEIFLSVTYRQKKDGQLRGGPMYYIPQAFTRRNTGKFFASVFAVLCLLSSFFLGNLVQVRAVADAVVSVRAVPKLWVGSIVLLFALLLIFSNRERVSKFTALVIPLLCLGYFLLTGWMIFTKSRELGTVFTEIFRGAFRPQAALGGTAAMAFISTLRQGIAKGVFSHEGGCGTAPISYAGVEDAHPVKEGVFGIVEVFVDTVVLCTMTALVLLLYPSGAQQSGLSLVMSSFSQVFGQNGRIFLLVAIVFFAFSTLVCWSFYGSECVRFFTVRNKPLTIYRLAFCLVTVFGVFFDEGVVWEINDFCTMSMTLINVLCLMRLSGTVRRETLCFFCPVPHQNKKKQQ